MRRNENVEAICGELVAVGIKPNLTRGDHVKIEWCANGRRRTYFTGSTPSDRLSRHKARSDVRRMLRMDGVLK